MQFSEFSRGIDESSAFDALRAFRASRARFRADSGSARRERRRDSGASRRRVSSIGDSQFMHPAQRAADRDLFVHLSRAPGVAARRTRRVDGPCARIADA